MRSFSEQSSPVQVSRSAFAVHWPSLGHERECDAGLLILITVLEIRSLLESNRAGFRKLPGTALKNGAGRTVFIPPKEVHEVRRLMGEFAQFWHGIPPADIDHLIRRALVHHQFERIHPFYTASPLT